MWIHQIVSQQILWKLCTLMNSAPSLDLFVCFCGHICLNLKVTLLHRVYLGFFKEHNWVYILNPLITYGSSLWINTVASFTTLRLLILSPEASTASSNLVFTCKWLHGSTCSCSTMLRTQGNFCSASSTRVVFHLVIFSGCPNVFPFPLQWPPRTPNNIFHFVKLSTLTKSGTEKVWKRETVTKCIY